MRTFWAFLVMALIVASGSSAVAVVAQPVGFVDVPPTHTFFTEIVWLKDMGITLGCNPPDNTLFCPSLHVTREQMAAFLSRALGLTEDGGYNWFTDEDGSIFENDIEKIAYAGITQGCNPPNNTLFCPKRPITRGEMAAFLTRALGLTEDGGYNWFTDDDGSIFENDIEKIAYAGITQGCNPPNNNLYCPAQPVTRGEMAAFLFRALGGETALIADLELSIVLVDEQPVHLFDLVDFEYSVENTGTVSVMDVVVDTSSFNGLPPFGYCRADIATVVVGDSDALLEPGEVWLFTCQSQVVTNGYGYHEATAQASDSDGRSVTAESSIYFTHLDAVETTVTPSASVVSSGDTVVWTFRVTNVGQEDIWHVSVEGRMIEETSVWPIPYWTMGSPTEIAGNGDDTLDPGEVWEWYDSKVVTSDAYYNAEVGCEPWYSDGGPYGFTAISEVVTVTSG